MSYPTDLKYTKDHEWIRFEGDTGAIGITDFAQQGWATWSTWSCPPRARS